MKVNWKVRLRNKTFLLAMLSAVIVFANTIAETLGYDITVISERVTTIAEYVLGFLALLGVVIDPTTSGVSDSERALLYRKPKE